MAAFLLHFLDSVGRHLLADHLLAHVLLAGLVVADRDEYAGCDVDCYATAEDDGRECEGPDVVGYSPRAGTEGDL